MRGLSPASIFGFVLAFAAVAMAAALAWVMLSTRPIPQPIAFSHRLHAGQYQLDCLFCHGNAARGAAASIPAVRDCYVCHWSVGEGRPEIVKLERLVEEGLPIRWRKVVRLPEHVQFSHEPHVSRGIKCAVCHGRVEEMEVTQQVRELKMGVCVECHWENQASSDCVVCHH